MPLWGRTQPGPNKTDYRSPQVQSLVIDGRCTQESCSAILRNTLAIGWDMGGWRGTKQAVAVARWEAGHPVWEGTPSTFSIADIDAQGGTLVALVLVTVVVVPVAAQPPDLSPPVSVLEQ